MDSFFSLWRADSNIYGFASVLVGCVCPERSKLRIQKYTDKSFVWKFPEQNDNYKTSNNQRLANAGEDDSYLFFSVMKDLKAHVEKGFA